MLSIRASKSYWLPALDSPYLLRIIGTQQNTKAETEESKRCKADREVGAQIETPAQRKAAQVPSRAAQGNHSGSRWSVVVWDVAAMLKVAPIARLIGDWTEWAA